MIDNENDGEYVYVQSYLDGLEGGVVLVELSQHISIWLNHWTYMYIEQIREEDGKHHSHQY